LLKKHGTENKILNVKVISARRQLKGQNVSISEELTKLNFQLSEKLQGHNLIEEAWSYISNIWQK
jgi:hypothetical protein